MNDNEETLLIAFTEFLNAVDAGVAAARQRIKTTKGLVKSDPRKIQWTQENGTKGPYEKSVDVDSADHKSLLKDLAGNHGFLRRDGFQYWVFQNGSTIGRRKLN